MISLIFKLPPGLPTAATTLKVVQVGEGASPPQLTEAPLSVLPQLGEAERVALVPPQRLSWLQVELPTGTLDKRFFREAGSTRLRTVLEGLLEERLLDDTGVLHFAVDPDARTGTATWVAVCDRVWLQSWLSALDQAGRAVTRIVPEFSPPAVDSQAVLRVHALGTANEPQLVAASAAGVVATGLTASALQWLLPVTEPGSANPPPDLQWWAEPAVAELAEPLAGQPVVLQTEAERAAAALQSPWDLAQFEFSASRQARSRKRWSSLWDTLLRAPEWRVARWSAFALVVAQLVGLQAWSWKVQTALDAKRQAIATVLTTTFPDTKIVVDAPVQMARSLAALQRQSGAASGADLETLLNQFGALAPASTAPAAIEFVANEVRISGLDRNAAEFSSIAANLQTLGAAARWDGATLVVAPKRTGVSP